MYLEIKNSGRSNPGRQEQMATSPSRQKYDIEERLLEFASAVIDVSEEVPDRRAVNHIGGQFLRAGTSPYGNHGEAQLSESRDDFIHKMKICLKELREAARWARLIVRKRWLAGARLAFVLQEGQELSHF